jgi:hypothetical protein
MSINEAWIYFQNHLINETAISDSDDGNAKEAYGMVCNFMESKLKETGENVGWSDSHL